MIKYKISKWNQKIECTKCDRETDHSVWINGVRSVKQTEWERYFDTFDDAKNYLIMRNENKIKSAELSISKAKKDLEEVIKLKKGVDDG